MAWITLYDIRDAQVLWTPVIVGSIAVVAGLGVLAIRSRVPSDTSRRAFGRSGLLVFVVFLFLVAPLQIIQTLQLRRDLNKGRYVTQEGIVTAAQLHQAGRHHETTLLFRVGNTWLQLPNETRSACKPQIGEPVRVAFGLRSQTVFAVQVHPAMWVQLSDKTCAPTR